MAKEQKLQSMTYDTFRGKLIKAAEIWFVKKSFVTEKEKLYCLKTEMRFKNIICTDVVEYIEKENLRKKSFLHGGNCNGLSSQAMLFNLVGPLIVRNNLEPLRIAFEEAGIPWPSGDVTAQFEYKNPRVLFENHEYPSVIDLVISKDPEEDTKSIPADSIFIEAKLTEKSFGPCKHDKECSCNKKIPPLNCDVEAKNNPCFHNKGERLYWDLMQKYGFREVALALSPTCPFAKHYQFFREVLFSLKTGGRFVLLHDDRNPSFLRTSKNGKESDLWLRLMELVPAAELNRIHRVTIQHVVKAIEDSGRHQDWIGEFKEKYGIE